MNTGTILKKSWQMLWQYKALWLYGAVLALFFTSAIPFNPYPYRDRNIQWTQIKITDTIIIQVPGENEIIDLTDQNGTTWQEFRALVDELYSETSINLWPILIELAVILVGVILIGTFARYIAETALVQMVSETSKTNRRLSVREGLRKGWSRGAWRLFLLDLTLKVLAFVAFVVVLGLAFVPILVAIGTHQVFILTVGAGALALLLISAYLWIAVSLLLSFVLQPIRRACVLENQSLLASISQGIRMARDHSKEVGSIWLIWLGIRMLLVPVNLPVLILLSPVLLLTILGGVIAGGLPAVLVALISNLFTSTATAWIMGALAAIPVFIIVMISPMLFFNGLVEVYLSSIWTLTYRELWGVSKPSVTTEIKARTQAAAAGGVVS